MSTDNKLAEALHVLLAACDDSDSAMYGTLGVSFVRDVAQAALAEHDAQPAPAPVQVDVLGELADEIEATYPNADASNLRAFGTQPPAPGEAEIEALVKAAKDAARDIHLVLSIDGQELELGSLRKLSSAERNLRTTLSAFTGAKP